MLRTQTLKRICAKYRAGRYGKGGRNKYHPKTRRQKALLTAFLMMGIGIGMLYLGKLPLLCPKPSFYVSMNSWLEAKKSESGKKESPVLLIQYAGEEQEVLLMKKVDGKIPEKKKISNEIQKIDVKTVLEERFGNTSEIPFTSFLSNYYIEDVSTKATEENFDIDNMLNADLTIEKNEKPQILIFHTHGSEGYVDSRSGVSEDTVVGAGELLASVLQEEYGYHVIHEKTLFDRTKEGKDDRNNAYNNALPVITSILEQYPSIEVVIDLHRDSGSARTSEINGVKTAKVMLFNGLCRTKDGPISYYSNENLGENLAFSLHLQVTGNELFPGLMHRIYLKSYRYNMHLKGKYLLVELGTNNNTVAEAKAAMRPFAKVLSTVLSK